MNDAQYLFRQTEIERKKLGYGDKHKKRGGGRYVRLPSDHLTKKERDAMNGEVNVYRLNEPVKWPEFKKWPEDIQRQYLLLLREKFNASDAEIGQMLGVARPTMSQHAKRLGISGKRGGNRLPLRKEEWEAFFDRGRVVLRLAEDEPSPVEETPAAVEETPAAVEETPAAVEETPEAELKFSEAELSILRLAELLVALKGSGAKLTVEVVL